MGILRFINKLPLHSFKVTSEFVSSSYKRRPWTTSRRLFGTYQIDRLELIFSTWTLGQSWLLAGKGATSIRQQSESTPTTTGALPAQLVVILNGTHGSRIAVHLFATHYP